MHLDCEHALKNTLPLSGCCLLSTRCLLIGSLYLFHRSPSEAAWTRTYSLHWHRLSGSKSLAATCMHASTGEDLHKMLWLKSRNSEVWLERRTGYTRSTAVMSMVGYLLGLGDRHPSNLMLDRYSGKLLHIDFGDCFEVSSRPFCCFRCNKHGQCQLCAAVPFKYCCFGLHGVLTICSR